MRDTATKTTASDPTGIDPIGTDPTGTLAAERSVLLLIDFQEKLLPVIADVEEVLANAVLLTKAARLLGVPTLGTEQNPAGIGHLVPEIGPYTDDIVTKTTFDACGDPALLPALPEGRDQIVVTGCETHICVLQTCLGLLRAGYQVAVVADAVGSRKKANTRRALQRLARAGADIVTAEMVVFEWLERSDRAEFRDVLKLIR
jgi:nicotinamidase-related amidase